MALHPTELGVGEPGSLAAYYAAVPSPPRATLVPGSEEALEASLPYPSHTPPLPPPLPPPPRWIDAFPFPFYVVLRELQTLPQVLSDALRQWFELLRR